MYNFVSYIDTFKFRIIVCNTIKIHSSPISAEPERYSFHSGPQGPTGPPHFCPLSSMSDRVLPVCPPGPDWETLQRSLTVSLQCVLGKHRRQ